MSENVKEDVAKNILDRIGMINPDFLDRFEKSRESMRDFSKSLVRFSEIMKTNKVVLDFAKTPISALSNFEIIVSDHAIVSRWVFPQKRFVEYEPSDERWCRYFGIGHEVREPGCIRVGGRMYVHPEIWQRIEKIIPPYVERGYYPGLNVSPQYADWSVIMASRDARCNHSTTGASIKALRSRDYQGIGIDSLVVVNEIP